MAPTSVTAEYLFVDYCSYWEAVETICKCLPQFDGEAPLTCKPGRMAVLNMLYIYDTMCGQ